MGDVDTSLRNVAGMRPADLAAPFVGKHMKLVELPEVEERDSQLLLHERRADKILAVQVGEETCLLNVEFQVTQDPNMGLRALEYLTAISVRERFRGSETLRVKSVVVLLEGPQRCQAGWVHHWHKWPDDEEGLRATFWLEPVYQCAVAELQSRPEFWWVFTPLARDVDAGVLDSVLRELKERIKNAEVLGEMGLAMQVLAERNQRVSRLQDRIWPILGREIMEESTTLRREREKARAKERRTLLLKLAGKLFEPEQVEELERLGNDALEERVFAMVDARTPKKD